MTFLTRSPQFIKKIRRASGGLRLGWRACAEKVLWWYGRWGATHLMACAKAETTPSCAMLLTSVHEDK